MTSTSIELSRGVDFAARLRPVYLLLFLLIAASLSPGAASPKGLLTPMSIKLSRGGDLRSVLFLVFVGRFTCWGVGVLGCSSFRWHGAFFGLMCGCGYMDGM